MHKLNANDTMRLLEKQNAMELLNIEPNLWGVIKDIMTANGIPEEFFDDEMFMMGVYIIHYGVVLGKRIERQRNKSKYGLSESQRDYMRAILEIVQNNNRSEDSCMIYKLRIATMLSAMRNEDYITKSYHYMLAKYRKEDKATRHHEETKPVNENYREGIRKMIEQTEDTHVLCCTYTVILTHLRILAEKAVRYEEEISQGKL